MGLWVLEAHGGYTSGIFKNSLFGGIQWRMDPSDSVVWGSSLDIEKHPMSPLTNNNFLSSKSIWYLTTVHQVNWDRSHLCHVSNSICFYTWVTIRLCKGHISIAFSDLQLPDLQNKTWISVCFHQLLSHKKSVWDRIAWSNPNRKFNIVWMAQGQMGKTSSQKCALANKENSLLHFFGEVTTVYRIILRVKQHPHCGLILI